MKEDFLAYLWQYQYFDKSALSTAAGEPLQVLRVGFANSDAGPDFLEARLRVGEVEWSGSAEIHVRASDWHRHQHQEDPRYDQVVLHVVWEADKPVHRRDGTLVPLLELKNRVKPGMLQTYQQLQKSGSTIPCAAFWPSVPEITKTAMMERTLVERLEQKGASILQNLTQNGSDWEQTAYELLCKGFGFKINQVPFERLARELPLAVVRKHRQSLFQVEALLYGQAGFLEQEVPEEEYPRNLVKEFSFLRHKHQLQPGLERQHWNFLRLRPANFPTVRLAQLAAVLAAHQQLFSRLIEAKDVKAYEGLFMQPVSAYWQQHYMIGRETASEHTSIGKSSVHNLIINVAVPLLAAYAQYTQERAYLEKAVYLLEKVKEASNRITRQYEELGWKAVSAADNQAAIGLFQRYCQPLHCLRCAIGHKILKQSPATA
ncbi:DUF2851 family protein [Pontibacter beigongshangensis]|uniref:DUF2851 family protein n=1 Tax=Pontibacter beigongshangensis TaxID=2574733 RepID=UPI00164F1382|nr:DUF2851 family protein [Pontibacter beigongshangensis]